MKLGDAFSMAVPPNYDITHLFFVISDPGKHNGTFIIVNLTSDYFRAGRECVLNVGDHPRITKESYISFADAIEITPERAQGFGKTHWKQNHYAQGPRSGCSCQNRQSCQKFQSYSCKFQEISSRFGKSHADFKYAG